MSFMNSKVMRAKVYDDDICKVICEYMLMMTYGSMFLKLCIYNVISQDPPEAKVKGSYEVLKSRPFRS